MGRHLWCCSALLLAACVAAVAAGTASAAGIQVQSATWGGQNYVVFYPNGCSPSTVQPGNWTAYTAAACDGRLNCTFTPDRSQACSGAYPCGDPAYGCAKDFSVSYTCNGGSAVQTAYTGFGQPSATLTCPNPITYSWSTGSFGSCALANQLCGPGSETRSVACIGSDGSSAPDSSCTGPKPASSQSCSIACSPGIVDAACAAQNPANHGAYVSCVAADANLLLSQGLIAPNAIGSYVSPAAKSSTGKKK